jgi:hypothetical protein
MLPFCSKPNLILINSELTKFVSNMDISNLSKSLVLMYQDSIDVKFKPVEEMFEKKKMLFWFTTFKNFFLTSEKNSDMPVFKTMIRDSVEYLSKRQDNQSANHLIKTHLFLEQKRVKEMNQFIYSNLFPKSSEQNYQELDEEDLQIVNKFKAKIFINSFYTNFRQKLLSKLFIDGSEVVNTLVRIICRLAANSNLNHAIHLINPDATVNTNSVFHVFVLLNILNGVTNNKVEYPIFNISDSEDEILII